MLMGTKGRTMEQVGCGVHHDVLFLLFLFPLYTLRHILTPLSLLYLQLNVCLYERKREKHANKSAKERERERDERERERGLRVPKCYEPRPI